MDLLKLWIEQREMENLSPEERRVIQKIKLEHFYNNQNQVEMIQYEQQPYVRIIEEFLKGKVDDLLITVNLYGNIECTFKWKAKEVEFLIKFEPFEREPLEIKIDTSKFNEEEVKEVDELLLPLYLELNNEWL